MKASSDVEVRELYEESAEGYAELMDSDIDLPVYADILGRLAERIAKMPGPVIDSSCGPGHLLLKYHECHEPERSLLGIDLSPRMVSIARSKLGSSARTIGGDMRDLGRVEPDSTAAVLSFFAVHHLGPEEVLVAFREWRRVLQPDGQLVVAAWEGTGPIDYGDRSDVVAFRYGGDEVAGWMETTGFVVDRCVIEPVEGMPMKAVYLEGSKE